MGSRELHGLELWDVEDVAPDIVADATAAARAKLDELGVSPLEAMMAMFNIQQMDDQGGLYSDDPNFEPDYARWEVVMDHLEAHNLATKAAGKVIEDRFPDRATGAIAIGVSDEVLAEWNARNLDLSKAE